MSIDELVVFLLFLYIFWKYFDDINKPEPEPMIQYLPTKIAIPINGVPDDMIYGYEQIGYLHSGYGGITEETTIDDVDRTHTNDDYTYDNMIPLFGKKINESWNYYVKTDRIYNIKVPLINKGHDCGGVNGCPELLNGDQVFMRDLNKVLTVRLFSRKEEFEDEETQ